MNDLKVEPVIDPTVRHKFELEDKEFDNTWRSCYLTLDKRATIYFTLFHPDYYHSFGNAV